MNQEEVTSDVVSNHTHHEAATSAPTHTGNVDNPHDLDHEAVATDAHAGHAGHDHDAHAEHAGHAGHADHADIFRRRFWVNLVLAIPVILYSEMVQEWLRFSMPEFPGSDLIAPVLGSVIFFYGGRVFLNCSWV